MAARLGIGAAAAARSGCRRLRGCAPRQAGMSSTEWARSYPRGCVPGRPGMRPGRGARNRPCGCALRRADMPSPTAAHNYPADFSPRPAGHGAAASVRRRLAVALFAGRAWRGRDRQARAVDSRGKIRPAHRHRGDRHAGAACVTKFAGPARALTALQDLPSAPTKRDYCSTIHPASWCSRPRRLASGISAGQSLRFLGIDRTGTADAARRDICRRATLAAGGRNARAQHCGPIGTRTIGLHSLLFGPPGACPAGQQTPVEVILLARQQEVPIGT